MWFNRYPHSKLLNTSQLITYLAMRRGRPRRYAHLRVSSFSYSSDQDIVLENLKRLAMQNGRSMSEEIMEAIQFYLRNHGFSPTNTPSFQNKNEEAKKFEAEVVATELRECIMTIRDARFGEEYRYSLLMKEVPKLVKRLANLNTHVNDENYNNLCQEAISLFKEKDRLIRDETSNNT